MMKLYGRLPILNAVHDQAYLVTVTKNAALPPVLRKSRAFLTGFDKPPQGFKAILTKEASLGDCDAGSDVFQISEEYHYLDEGDILSLNPTSGAMRALYRRHSHHNTILLTRH